MLINDPVTVEGTAPSYEEYLRLLEDMETTCAEEFTTLLRKNTISSMFITQAHHSIFEQICRFNRADLLEILSRTKQDELTNLKNSAKYQKCLDAGFNLAIRHGSTDCLRLISNFQKSFESLRINSEFLRLFTELYQSEKTGNDLVCDMCYSSLKKHIEAALKEPHVFTWIYEIKKISDNFSGYFERSQTVHIAGAVLSASGTPRMTETNVVSESKLAHDRQHSTALKIHEMYQTIADFAIAVGENEFATLAAEYLKPKAVSSSLKF